MQSWIKFVDTDKMEDGVEYFIGRHRNKGDAFHESCDLLLRGLNGKLIWGGKPGIAIRLVGGPELRQNLVERPHWSLVAIPSDTDTRWKARKASPSTKRSGA